MIHINNYIQPAHINVSDLFIFLQHTYSFFMIGIYILKCLQYTRLQIPISLQNKYCEGNYLGFIFYSESMVICIK